MFLKILVTLVLMVVAWTAVVRLTGPRPPRRRLRNRSRDKDMPTATKCAKCGIYLPPGESCHCTDRA